MITLCYLNIGRLTNFVDLWGYSQFSLGFLKIALHDIEIKLGQPYSAKSQLFQDCSIESIIVVKAVSHEEIAEGLAQIGTSGCLVKGKGNFVAEVGLRFLGGVVAKIFCVDCFLLLLNQIILLRLIFSCKTLPREGAPEKVEKHVFERFQAYAKIVFSI